MAHRFRLGQLVRLKRPNRTGSDIYEVVRLVPADADDVPWYPIRDNAGHERAVSETEIEEA
jgi:hypothetical protein